MTKVLSDHGHNTWLVNVGHQLMPTTAVETRCEKIGEVVREPLFLPSLSESEAEDAAPTRKVESEGVMDGGCQAAKPELEEDQRARTVFQWDITMSDETPHTQQTAIRTKIAKVQRQLHAYQELLGAAKAIASEAKGGLQRLWSESHDLQSQLDAYWDLVGAAEAIAREAKRGQRRLQSKLHDLE